jgi:hypothetical protein
MERMGGLCGVILTVNGIRRIDEVHTRLQEARDLLDVMMAMDPDELLDRACVSFEQVLASGEVLLLKASKSKLFSNTRFGKRVKEFLFVLQLENQRLVRRRSRRRRRRLRWRRGADAAAARARL